MFNLEISSKISEEELLTSIDSLTDNEKSDFAIRFGEGGDVNYELMLLSKLISTINEIYPPDDCKDDVEMATLTHSLLLIKPMVDKLIEY